ncbi:hypothetical protein SCHPADRAFT_935442 [Schizopora paradoxa]|uniref:Uncharacterized protein n=1 Tax=Schizopora paradoxa TaxID=27342 RepID=A0A0H2S5Y3_9AGAM|nr:hypothetical protein SCHPADRAFT_935442 [Schizopora paradoxa]
MSTRTLKRARSPSLEADAGLPVKRAKSALVTEVTTAAAGVLSEFGLFTPPLSELPPYDYEGLPVYNLHLVSVDEHGHAIPVSKEAPPVLEKISERTTGLITPEPTPMAVDDKPDPFLTASPAWKGHDSPANFAYTGDIRLLGLLPAQIFIYQHVSVHGCPYDEVITLTSGAVSLGDLLQDLRGTPLDAIALKQVQLCFARRCFDPRRPAGVYFETDVEFKGVLQPVSDFLRDFFKQEEPAIHFSAYIGEHRGWNRVAVPSTLLLRGSLEGISLNLFDVFEFKTIGVELLGHKQGGAWDMGYGFFGEVNLTVPKSTMPLQVTYLLRKCGPIWTLALRLKDDEWKDCFGVKGLNLREVNLLAFLSAGKAHGGGLTLQLGAIITLNGLVLKVSGSYGPAGYSLFAEIGNFTLHDLGALFYEFLEIELDIFDHDITFNSISLLVSSTGLTLAGCITINGHTTTYGSISLSRDGIAIEGGVGDLEFEGLYVKNAQFDVFIASKLDSTCARASKCAVMGSVAFSGIELDVSVILEKTPEKLYWTICGEMRGLVTTSKLVGELKDTFLDVSLERMALIATNHDKPGSSCGGLSYPVTKGIQFCALIDRIPQLEQLLRGSVKGMVFRASLDVESRKFSVGIILPAERTISFSESVYSGPLELAFEIGASPEDMLIMLKACLNVHVDTQPDPLAFALGLKAGVVGASAYGQMLNDWTSPCGLGKEIVIRKCALQFGIVYSTFFSTGTPGEIGLAGELSIGKKLAGVAMKVTQNPKEQLLVAEIVDLGVTDLVHFASLVVGHEIPDPGDILHFNELSLYLSTGTSIGLTYYPAGVSAKGDMRIFGKRAKFELSLALGVKIMATIEAFELGPLKVHGAARPDPIVDVEISAAKQAVLIDGAVEIWGLTAALHLDAQLYPSPKLDFWVHLTLADLLIVKLEAKLSGVKSFKSLDSLAGADFEVYALVEQNIVDEVVKQLSQQIQAAKDAAKHGFDELKAKMDEKEALFKAGCQAAIDHLEVKRKEWHEKKAAVDAEFARVQADVTRTREELERKVDEAERAFKAVLAQANAALEEAKHDAAAAIMDAERAVEDAQRDSDESIRSAQNDLQSARDFLNNNFGSAIRDLENARYAVEDAQRTIDNLDREIDEGGATVGLQTARGFLYAAQGIVHSTGFVAAEGAVAGCQTALEGVRLIKTEALNVAKDGLREVREDQAILVEAAQSGLKSVEEACDELNVFNAAKEALRAGEGIAHGMISTAQAGVDALANCAEFVAFDVAEKALKFAQENTSELNLARHALTVAEGAVNVGLEIGNWAVSHAGEIFNIRKMEFSGSVRSLTSKDGPPLRVAVEGVVFGEKVDFELVWKPHFDLVEFIKELFRLLWAEIQRMAKELFS